MPVKFIYSIFIVVTACLTQFTIYSQNANVPVEPKDSWIRVQSDDGEFSIDVPAKNNFYYNEDGFYITKDYSDYRLGNMRMLNAYSARTLLSFEIYKAKKAALEAIYERDTSKRNELEKAEVNKDGSSIRQVTTKSDGSYCRRQYFHSKTNIYVLTVISRGSETLEARRFLDSVVFKPGTKDISASSVVLLSKLPVTEIGVEQKIEKDTNSSQASIKPPDKPLDKNIVGVIILNKPNASYTAQARRNGLNGVQGVVRLKPTLSADGFVSNIVVVKSLPDGLLRQALFAAIRIKFLPRENQGNPEDTVVTIDYSFSIY